MPEDGTPSGHAGPLEAPGGGWDLARVAAVALLVLGLVHALPAAWALLAGAAQVGRSTDPETRGWVAIATALEILVLAVGLVLVLAAVGVARGHRWGTALGVTMTFMTGVVASLAATSQGWMLVVAIGCWITFAALVMASRRRRGSAPTDEKSSG